MRIYRRLFLGLYLLFTASSGFADTITLVADEWCPYNCTPESKEPGFLIEIAEYGLQKGGHMVAYSVMPWTRAIEETRLGKHTAIVGAHPTEVPDFIYPKVALGKASNDFFVKSGSSWNYENLRSLENISLGAIKDYAYSDEIDNYIKKNSKINSLVQIATGEDALEKNINKLIAGRIDAMVEDHSVVEYYLKKHNMLGQISVAGSLGDDDIFVAFSPSIAKSKEYADLVAAGVEELRSNGKMEEILSKYGVQIHP